ncbi:MAG: tetratricopeptide repeat protein [Candidatus Firestonebacteria bacterium]
MRKLILAAAVFVFSFCAFAGEAADTFFHNGVKKYIKKNYDGAIADVEKAISLGTSEKNANAFLVKILIERGSNLYENKQYKEALFYFEKAKKLQPDNKDLENIITAVNDKLKPVVEKIEITVERESERVAKELLINAQAQQNKIIESLTKPNEIMRRVLSKSDEERKKLYELLEKKNNSLIETVKSEKTSVKNIIIYGVGIFTVLMILAIGFIYVFSIRAALRREALLIKQQEAIMGLVMQQQQALAQGHSTLHLAGNTSPGGTVTPKLMLNDPNPRVRAKGIEIIDAEFVKENEDPEVAEKILKDFLRDNNNRVRANAVKSIYKYRPEEAYSATLEMLESGDKWMKISGIWVLGEFEGDTRAVELLLKYKNNKDLHLRGRLLKSLIKINNSEKKLPALLAKKVSEVVAELAKTSKT